MYVSRAPKDFQSCCIQAASTDFSVLVHLQNQQNLLLASIPPLISLSMSFSK